MTTIEENSIDSSSALFDECCDIQDVSRCCDPDNKLCQVQAHIRWEQEEMALAILKEMLIDEPKNHNLLAYKAFLLMTLDRDVEARQLCDQLLVETNGEGISSEEYQIPKGFIHFIKALTFVNEEKKEKFEEALILLNQAIQYEDYPLYFVFRASTNVLFDEFEAALHDAELSIKQIKGDSLFLSDQNVIYELLGDMYAIRACCKVHLNLGEWKSDYNEAVKRESEWVNILFQIQGS